MHTVYSDSENKQYKRVPQYVHCMYVAIELNLAYDVMDSQSKESNVLERILFALVSSTATVVQ